MDATRLQRLLDAYGADPARWPAEERDAALAMLAASPAARAAQAEAARLDALLDAVPTPEASPDLARRIVAAAASSRASARRRRPAVRRLVIGLVPLAAAAGLTLWLARPAPTPVAPPTDLLALAASLDDVTAPSDDLLAVAGLDVAGTGPSYGCTRGELGCPDLGNADAADGRRSLATPGRSAA